MEVSGSALDGLLLNDVASTADENTEEVSAAEDSITDSSALGLAPGVLRAGGPALMSVCSDHRDRTSLSI